ncbi:MAG: hypothetical protein AAGD43_21445 [Pseudomonadota bacterium]
MSILGSAAVKLIGGQIAKEVIPDLFGKLGGERAERVAQVATETVLDVAGITQQTKPSEAISRLRDDPVAYARVQEVLEQKALHEIQLQKQLAEIDAADRADARAMHIQREDSTISRLVYIAALLAAFSLGSLVWMIAAGVKIDGPALTLLTTAIALSLSYLGQIMNFYFGSSSGSKAKTDLMNRHD